jgi:exosortase/archaeosortase family protein
VRPRWGFGLLFLVYLGLLWSTLGWQTWLGTGYLYPLSWLAARLLGFIGVPVTFDPSLLSRGTCALLMDRVIFHVTYDCAGFFALLVYVAAVLAYPATTAWRAAGILAGTGALFAYGVLRLVILALVGHLAPSWLSFLHLYLLVLMNVGFVIFLWAIWVDRAKPSVREVAR